MIYDSQPIDDGRRAEIIHLTRNTEHRNAITEVLQELSMPRQVSDLDCVKILADLMRYILTLFVHEK
jgi:hypothetical protein